MANHLTSLVMKMLEEMEAGGGEVPLHPEQTSIAHLIHESVAVVRPTADEHGIVLRSRVPDGLQAVVDPDRLRQVVIQLLENAVTHCPEGTTVEATALTCTIDGREGVELVVSDDGPGIPERHQEQIFEPYRSFRGRVGASEGGRGSGLGLSIVRALVSQMGGEIDLESSLGSGTTFTIRLPSRRLVGH